MRIERATTIQEILACLPFERTVRKKKRDDTKESDMLLFIQAQLNNPLFSFWIAYNDADEVIGYWSGIINLLPGYKRLMLLRFYSKYKKLMPLFEEKAKEWLKPYGVRVVSITVRKNIKGLKKYGFEPVSVNMERRI